MSAIEGAALDPFLANFRRSEELLPLDSSLSPVGGGRGKGGVYQQTMWTHFCSSS